MTKSKQIKNDQFGYFYILLWKQLPHCFARNVIIEKNVL